MLEVLSVAEVCDEDGGVVETLYDGVHVAGVTQVLQPRQPAALLHTTCRF